MCPATTRVSVEAETPALRVKATALATRLGLAFGDEGAEFALQVTNAGLQLNDRTRREQPLQLDFVKLFRQRGPATSRSLLGRASGIRRADGIAVLDCTGGLGRDA